MSDETFIDLAINYVNGMLSETMVDAMWANILKKPERLNLLITIAWFQNEVL